MPEHDFTPPGAVRVVDLGSDISTHHYADGSIRVRHRCKTVGDIGMTVAPALQLGHGHSVIRDEPLTIVASVLCPDCGLHGFITDGRWVA